MKQTYAQCMFVMLAHECSISWTGVFEGIYEKPNACQESAECECMMLMVLYFVSFIISVTCSFLSDRASLC